MGGGWLRMPVHKLVNWLIGDRRRRSYDNTGDVNRKTRSSATAEIARVGGDSRSKARMRLPLSE